MFQANLSKLSVLCPCTRHRLFPIDLENLSCVIRCRNVSPQLFCQPDYLFHMIRVTVCQYTFGEIDNIQNDQKR